MAQSIFTIPELLILLGVSFVLLLGSIKLLEIIHNLDEAEKKKNKKK